MDLVIVTHGATDASEEICIGQQDVDLASSGFAAIQSLAATWSGPPPRFLCTSDLRRAQQSAQVFAAQFAIEPLPDPRLRELDLGAWQGHAWSEIVRIDEANHRLWRHNPAIHAPPGGESLSDLMHRTGTWLAAMLAATGEEDIVLAVAHGSTLRALLSHSLGLAPARANAVAALPAHASMLRCREGRFEVCYLNTTVFQHTQVSAR